MNSGCGSPIEMAGGARDLLENEPGARDLLENENGNRCGLVSAAGGIEWLRDERSTTTPSTIGPKQWFCLFRGDAGPMAISVESVAEVLETDTLVRLAWSPPQVVGMCPYHRDVVPVVKLGPLPRDLGEEVLSGQDQTVAIDTAGEMAGIDERTRCVVLILKTEQGAWGIRIDSENTIMSRESPQCHSPRIYANGPVLIGIVRLAGTCYGILDAEATWRGLRSSVGRWSGLISESNPSSPLPSGEESIPAGPVASQEHWEA
jgi:chemotaxis signal transduction protein